MALSPYCSTCPPLHVSVLLLNGSPVLRSGLTPLRLTVPQALVVWLVGGPPVVDTCDALDCAPAVAPGRKRDRVPRAAMASRLPGRTNWARNRRRVCEGESAMPI